MLTNAQRLAALFFLVSSIVIAMCISADPATMPTTHPTTEMADKMLPRYQLLKKMKDTQRAIYIENENRLNAIRSRLNQQGSDPESNISLHEQRLNTLTQRKLEMAMELKRAQFAKELLAKSIAANKNTAEVISTARADSRVQYLEHRLEDAEIRLLTAGSASSPTRFIWIISLFPGSCRMLREGRSGL